MNKKAFLLSAAALAAVSAAAQTVTANHIAWPESRQFPTYVTQWANGSLNLEDENFFISRVKPHVTFRNVESQVYPGINETNDKRLIFWVPVNARTAGYNINALPNGVFNSEVFSTWAYITHFGDWLAPQGFVPGALADAAHKNGVAVSSVASIPFGGISTEWSQSLTEQANLSSETIAKFMLYHGLDGLGYNSEFSGNSAAVQKIAQQHGEIVKYLNEHGNPLAEHVWYDGTNWNGSISFDQGLQGHNAGIFGADKQRRASLFFNYNWGRNQNLAKSVTYANNMGIDPLYIYAGFNQQGNDPGTNNWKYLSQHNVSVGLWGAHEVNYIWAGRNENGSTPMAMQKCYQTRLERFFGNGPQNPAIKLPVKDGSCIDCRPTFFGMSAFMSARSALNWNLSDEPFITNFNLGNGTFFNWEGKRVHSQEWYNLGVQDYLPTWRYWWAKTLRGREVEAGSIGLNAAFTWDDAYLGGSCLEISGTDADAYLHLFKTRYELAAGDEITVTYKLLKGKADVNLVLALEGAETAAAREGALAVMTAEQEADDVVWVTKTFKVTGANATALRGKTVAIVGLHFTNADNLDMLLGGFSITRPDAAHSATPATPRVTLSKVIATHYKGVDGKIIWEMPNNKPAGEPCYNLDVKTSFFKLYAQSEGGEPLFMGITTSWAGLIYSAPVDIESAAKVRFGVAAVSLDLTADSEIAWGEWLEKSNNQISEEIEITHTMLKPGEPFTVKFSDGRHAPVNWGIYNNLGEKVASATNATEIHMGQGIAEVGGYDVVVNDGTDHAVRHGYFVQISPESVGAFPVIYSTSVNGNKVGDEAAIELEGNDATLSYTSRYADGQGSRGLNFSDKAFGVSVAQLGLQAGQTFSISGWLRLDYTTSDNNSFVTIEDRAGSWPYNNWGWFWSRLNEDGTFNGNYVDTYWGMRTANDGTEGMRLFSNYNDSKLAFGAWTHFAIVFEFDEQGHMRNYFYLNGVRQNITAWVNAKKSLIEGARDSQGNEIWNNLAAYTGSASAKGQNQTETGWVSHNYSITSNDWISVGGAGSKFTSIGGLLDDFTVWSKALTEEDVRAAMAGLDRDNLPAEVIAFWDFEDETITNNAFRSLGKKKARAYLYELATGENEGQGGKVYIPAIYDAGCPFISGTTYKVETRPSWSASRGVVSEAVGNSTEGSAKVTYKAEGDYNVTLTLANSHGADTAAFPVLTVTNVEGGINEVEQANRPATIVENGAILVEFPAAGTYTVAVTNAVGVTVAEKTLAVGAAQRARIAIGVPGVYVVAVSANGTPLRAAKLLVK